MKKTNAIKTISKVSLVLVILFTPIVSQAAGFVSIVPDCVGSFGSDQVPGQCGWEDLIKMGQNIINDAVYLVAILSVISVAYAGYLYVTSGGNDSQIKKAHEVFGKVVWGIFLTLGAWLIVHEVLKYLGVTDASFTLLG